MGFMAGLANPSSSTNQTHHFSKQQEIRRKRIHKAHEKTLESSKCTMDCYTKQQLAQKEIEEDREWHRKSREDWDKLREKVARDFSCVIL
jgi:ribonucleotide reductase alpha subunit